MNIVLKHTLKNIFCKPLRTFVVTFSIFLCALCALMCFDLVGEMKEQINGLYSELFGSADILFYDELEREADMPECSVLPVKMDLTYFYSDVEGEYNYVHADGASIYSFEFMTAEYMDIYTDVIPGNGEAVISYKLADKYGYSIGDTVEVKDRNNDKHQLTVAGILPNDQNNFFCSGCTLIVNDATISELSGGVDLGYSISFIDVTDDSRIDEMQTYLEDHFPGAEIENITNNEEMNEMMDQVTAVLILVFAITLLLVVFVTISICEKIISERMTVIGTLRSLGMNNLRTAGILLLENVFYGLIGSLPAVLVYTLIREPLLSGMFNATDSEGNTIATSVHPLSMLVVFGVVAGCILAECLLPLKAVITAMRTPIRDIIFDNRDTAYVLKRRSVVTGCIFLAASVTLWMFHDNIYCMVAFVVTTVLALALLMPVILILISKVLQKLFAKTDNMPWELASREMSARKSTIGSGVLCATSAAICITLISVAAGAMNTFVMPEVGWDAQISISFDKDYLKYVETLDGVTDHEYWYSSCVEVGVNGKVSQSTELVGMADGGFRMTHDFSGLPSSIEDGYMAVDSVYARKHNVKVGDTITITVDPKGVFPVEREFTVCTIFDVTGGYLNETEFVISLDDYIRLYGDTPSYLYVQCDNPEEIVATVRKYSNMYSGYNTMTREEYIAMESEDTSPLVIGMAVIIAIGVGMTCIGTASNQVIGFEGRKRECAVMLSTSVNKRKLSGVLLKEVLLASFFSSVLGTVAGVALVNAIMALFEEMGDPMMVSVSPVLNILFMLGLALVFTLTVLFPIGTLRKMNISEQLKYE